MAGTNGLNYMVLFHFLCSIWHGYFAWCSSFTNQKFANLDPLVVYANVAPNVHNSHICRGIEHTNACSKLRLLRFSKKNPFFLPRKLPRRTKTKTWLLGRVCLCPKVFSSINQWFCWRNIIKTTERLLCPKLKIRFFRTIKNKIFCLRPKGSRGRSAN